MRLAAKKIVNEFEFDRHCWLLELLPAGPSPFIRARSLLSPTPNYKIICATFSFKKQRALSADLVPSSYAPIAQAFARPSDEEREKLRAKFDIAYFVGVEIFR